VATRVWYETHSTTLDNEAGVATGWLPGELSEVGRQQALTLARRIDHRKPDVIFCSDLARAVQTATVALEQSAIQPPVLLDWRLRECDYGRLNGAPSTEVHRDRVRYAHHPYPDGESWQTAIDRVAAATSDAAARHAGGTIMIIGHIATYLGVRRAAGDSTPLADLITEEFVWQPGWVYDLGSEPAGKGPAPSEAT
jgi:broad specificity phosphatase PhoE